MLIKEKIININFADEMRNNAMRRRQIENSLDFSINVNEFHRPNDKCKKVTFQESVRVLLILGQVFALNPVLGVSDTCVYRVRFVKTSWKCIFTIIVICGQIFMTVMCIIGNIFLGAGLDSATGVIFFATTLISTSMFLNIASRWPKLVHWIAKTEELDPNPDQKLILRSNMTCYIVISLALIEHILSLSPGFVSARYCLPQIPMNTYEDFVQFYNSQVFRFIPYFGLLGVFVQFLGVQSTFTWNFSDLFVIVISYYLISRLQNINNKLKDVRGKDLPEPFWRTVREDYNRVTQIVRKVDDVIGGIVFISFANNLFYVCLQLFHSLDVGFNSELECNNNRIPAEGNIGGYVTSAYFLYSLLCLITRSIAVSLVASQVHTASTVPVSILYDVPSSSYCSEVQRFIDQVNGEHVALTGLQFFSITRGLLLSVAATIVTYELVMFQFNSSDQPIIPAATTMAAVTLLTPRNDTK